MLAHTSHSMSVPSNVSHACTLITFELLLEGNLACTLGCAEPVPELAVHGESATGTRPFSSKAPMANTSCASVAAGSRKCQVFREAAGMCWSLLKTRVIKLSRRMLAEGALATCSVTWSVRRLQKSSSCVPQSGGTTATALPGSMNNWSKSFGG